MKNLVKFVCVLFLAFGIYANAQKSAPKPKPKKSAASIAAVDAAGALGGAGSVASIASWFAWTPAAPVAGLAIAAGAIVGGAGASIAYASKTSNIPNDPRNINNSTIGNNSNYIDQVGVMHNQLLFDYYSLNKEYDVESYILYVENNYKNYNFDKNVLTKEFIIKQNRLAENFSTNEDITNYILNNLPETADKVVYKSFLEGFYNQTNSDNANHYITSFENSELGNEKYDDRTKFILGSFFSTLRYSYNLWY